MDAKHAMYLAKEIIDSPMTAPFGDLPSFWAEIRKAMGAVDSLPADGDSALALESVFRDLLKRVEHAMWIHQNSMSMAIHHIGNRHCDRSLNLAVQALDSRLEGVLEAISNKATVLRKKVYTSIQRELPERMKQAERLFEEQQIPQCLTALEIILTYATDQSQPMELLERIRNEHAIYHAEATLLADRFRYEQLAALTISCPMPVYCMTSNIAGTLYLSSFDVGTWRGHLSLCPAGCQTPTIFTGSDVMYSGVWFDSMQERLYALVYRENSHFLKAIDIFDPAGMFIKRIEFSAALNWLNGPALLRGDEENLYLQDLECAFIVKIDKTNLEQFDIIDIHTFGPSACCSLSGSHLVFARRTHNYVGDFNLVTKQLNSVSGYDALACSQVYSNPSNGHIFAVAMDGVPSGYEPRVHWLMHYDSSLNLLSRRWLGEIRILDMHILAEKQLLVLSDYSKGLLFYRLDFTKEAR